MDEIETPRLTVEPGLPLPLPIEKFTCWALACDISTVAKASPLTQILGRSLFHADTEWIFILTFPVSLPIGTNPYTAPDRT